MINQLGGDAWWEKKKRWLQDEKDRKRAREVTSVNHLRTSPRFAPAQGRKSLPTHPRTAAASIGVRQAQRKGSAQEDAAAKDQKEDGLRSILLLLHGAQEVDEPGHWCLLQGV